MIPRFVAMTTNRSSRYSLTGSVAVTFSLPERATLLYRALCETADRLRAGDRNLDQLCAQARDTLTAAGFAVDYFTVLAADDLSPALPAQRNLVILVAAKIGSTRLIDNLVVNV